MLGTFEHIELNQHVDNPDPLGEDSNVQMIGTQQGKSDRREQGSAGDSKMGFGDICNGFHYISRKQRGCHSEALWS